MPPPAQGSGYSSNSIDLSGPVQLDECDNATRGHLERVRAYLDDSQWDEAIETLRQVMETGGDRVIRLDASDSTRFVSVRDYCQLKIAELYPERREALTLYRQRVDPRRRRDSRLRRCRAGHRQPARACRPPRRDGGNGRAPRAPRVAAPSR
jgi:hypothetical protein